MLACKMQFPKGKRKLTMTNATTSVRATTRTGGGFSLIINALFLFPASSDP